MTNALQKSIQAIEDQFALESVTVLEPSWVYGMGAGISGMMINPGVYPIAPEPRMNPNNLHMITATPMIAHHLRSLGKAAVTYKNQSNRMEW